MPGASADPLPALAESQTPGAGGPASEARLLRHPIPAGVLALAAAALAFAVYPIGADAALVALIAAVLVVLGATDLERRIIPNRVVVPAAGIILVARVAIFPGRAPEFILCAFGAGVAFLVPNLISSSLMGMGDVKLAFLLGAGLGLGVVGAVTIAFLTLFPFAVGTLVRGGFSARKSALPFGPFLALGGLVVLIVPRLAGLG